MTRSDIPRAAWVASATARAAERVRDAGLGLPTTTAMRIAGCYVLGRTQAVTSSPMSLSWSSRSTRSAM